MMTDVTRIPGLALLGLSFTGCSADGIVGTWRATERAGMALPIVEVEGPKTSTSEGFLVIGEDLRGELQLREHVEGPGYAEHDGYDVEIEVEAKEGFFVVSAFGYYAEYYAGSDEDEAVPFLLCKLDGDRLSCTSLADSTDDFEFVRKD